MVWGTFFPRLPVWQGGGGLKLFGQCPYRTNTFQKGASLKSRLCFVNFCGSPCGDELNPSSVEIGEYTWTMTHQNGQNCWRRKSALGYIRAWLIGGTIEAKISWFFFLSSNPTYILVFAWNRRLITGPVATTVKLRKLNMFMWKGYTVQGRGQRGF